MSYNAKINKQIREGLRREIHPEIRELSVQEKDYIDTLEEWLKSRATAELLDYQPERLEDFVNFLRICSNAKGRGE